eukprot:CAMPEP_0174262220 /NCGR_PEP_ID=MMETSP0439-20130205/12847_1 /TAXON_ID=0 /ORGANISM="Stereomyxa ramosa, Strain Chinc5" /LENGTH=725 /DNA_ID=CAMNT_0015346893 /DNA_START=48 /DNA_END=2225 /DNA_ORIENTATION=-
MDKDRGIRRLLQVFGQQLDREVLESVLEICGGDPQAAVQFLQAQGDDYIEPPANQQGETLPKDYMFKPKGYQEVTINEEEAEDLTLQLKRGFLRDTPFLEHLSLQEKQYPTYCGVLLLLLEKGVELGALTKARVLASAWARHDWALAEYLLDKDQYALPDILKAVRILDAPRKVKALEKRLARLQKQGTAKPRTIGLIRATLNDIKKEIPSVEEQATSVTGSLAKKIKRWVSTIPPADLEFYALQLPKKPWQELSDVVHFHPKDFQLDWFLPHVYGAAPPENSLVVQSANLSPETILEAVTEFRFPYSYLRKQFPDLPDEVKAEVAKYEKLDTLIWYYEELTNPTVDALIAERLDNGEELKFSYGKLMERLLYFKLSGAPFYDRLIPIAEERLHQIRLPLEPPVVVLGDASYSMDVAIRTATIIGSLLTVLTNAELKFFNVDCFKANILPRKVSEVLQVATETKADGLTAPACSLWEYYKKKEVVKFFVVVTDEIENEKSEGEFFAQLFYRYYSEVYPAKLVFVSFLDNPSEKGRMVRSLENLGIVPLQFRLDATRPDLTKVDTLLGLLSSEGNFFGVQVGAIAEQLQDGPGGDNLKAALAVLANLPLPEDPRTLKRSRRGIKQSQDEAEETEGNAEEEEGGKGKEKEPSILDEDHPEEFVCPITQELMNDPVVAVDGHTYERSAITEWLSQQKTSPMSGASLETTVLYPNFGLRSRIKAYLEKK